MIILDSLYKKDKNYHPQVFLEERKNVIKETKKSIKKFVANNIEISSDDSDKENSDEENVDDENFDKQD